MKWNERHYIKCKKWHGLRLDNVIADVVLMVQMVPMVALIDWYEDDFGIERDNRAFVNKSLINTDDIPSRYQRTHTLTIESDFYEHSIRVDKRAVTQSTPICLFSYLHYMIAYLYPTYFI